MILKSILKKKNISAYQLSKESGVPYMTINDLINGKTTPTKCTAETIYKIAKCLNVSIEELLEPYMNNRISFELFKSNICHRLKELGDINFLIDLIDKDEITYYFNLKWYPECLYLLAMLDYLSRINNVPICSEYEKLRSMKLSSIVYPSSILAMDLASKNDKAKLKSWNDAIPEFKRFNIVESDIRNII